MSPPRRILGQIALSLSGGGYRAAAFHLGTLDMLKELELLDDITVLSTVSGGSITGAAFAVARANEKAFGNSEFRDFHDALYRFMKTTNVITRALHRLGETCKPNDIEAMPSLIRAAADVYASDALFENATLKSLRSAKGGLDEVVINATDFHTGNSFRFQNSSNPEVRSGNNNSEIPPAVNAMIRVADAVAASACFPSGFEPIRFPDDFKWQVQFDISYVRHLLRASDFRDEIPLMDGGVFDNQGIDSIENICRRKSVDVGIYIISDTSQRSGNLLDFPVNKRRGVVSFSVWYWLIMLLATGSLATMITAAWDLLSLFLGGQLTSYRELASQLIPVLFSAAVFVLILYGRHRFRQGAANIEEKTQINLWDAIKGLTIPELAELVNARARSLIVMSSSVFMKHIRNLAFTSLFADPAMNKKLIPVLIYDIDNEPRWGKEIVEAGLQPTQKLRDLVCRAESYDTNLWFQKTGDLDDLIACGRATICFKILKYLLNQRSIEIKDSTKPESELFQLVMSKWLELNELQLNSH